MAKAKKKGKKTKKSSSRWLLQRCVLGFLLVHICVSVFFHKIIFKAATAAEHFVSAAEHAVTVAERAASVMAANEVGTYIYRGARQRKEPTARSSQVQPRLRRPQVLALATSEPKIGARAVMNLEQQQPLLTSPPTAQTDHADSSATDNAGEGQLECGGLKIGEIAIAVVSGSEERAAAIRKTWYKQVGDRGMLLMTEAKRNTAVDFIQALVLLRRRYPGAKW
jgi:hypothetical protein